MKDIDFATPSAVPAVLGIIAARGGSKGVPRKNVKPLAGKPLIGYTIDAARQSRRLSRVVVSTDDGEIAQVAQSLGAEVPFRRPAELASDTARQIDVLVHATLWVEQDERRRYDVIVVLQPTAPLRTAEDIDRTVAMLLESDADSAVSFAPTTHGHPYYMYSIVGNRPEPFIQVADEPTGREAFPPAYVRNGAVYAVRRDVLIERGSLYGDDCRAYVMPPERSVNIDSHLDWKLAEVMVRELKCA